MARRDTPPPSIPPPFPLPDPTGLGRRGSLFLPPLPTPQHGNGGVESFPSFHPYPPFYTVPGEEISLFHPLTTTQPYTVTGDGIPLPPSRPPPTYSHHLPPSPTLSHPLSNSTLSHPKSSPCTACRMRVRDPLPPTTISHHPALPTG